LFFVRVHFCALWLLTTGLYPAIAQSQPSAVESVSVLPQDGGASIEIRLTKPVTPQLQTVERPLRLVIDLPNSSLATPRRHITFRNDQIEGVRVNQYQPTVSRVVVDLAVPVRFTWNALGNRLNIRIRPDEAATAKPAAVPTAIPATQPVAVPYVAGAAGAVAEAGSRVGTGSSITAKEETAVLRLTRGGEVHVCPRTTLSVATSAGGQELMLGMNTGAIETHYHLNESSDSILTPDFRIILPGPGEFNLAVKSDPSGDTCVSSLAGNNASVVVAEILGTGTYEIKPDQQVLFRRGRMQSVETPLISCGCPLAEQPVMRATGPSSVLPEQKVGTEVALGNSSDPADNANGTGNVADGRLAAPPVAPSSSGENKAATSTAQVSTPLVFDVKEFQRMRAETPPALGAKVASLPLSTKPADPLPALVVLPPPQPQHKGFFGKVGAFFRSLF